ncbi:MAG: DUF669 domain-containing protein [Firmicutes bacterium]|nr:DUF669 domain-containing protein [Bacillota bacterium]MDY4106794.1 DUF669 domain-containing protein [Oscillospiraceae bacterium]
MTDNKIERELGWDDQIENDSSGEYLILPDGDYNFTVKGFTRGRHDGSDKLPPCNKAIIDIEITAPQGTITIKHNLFLHTKCEGLLCEFFTAIGDRKRGEPLRPNWSPSHLIGKTGRLKLGSRAYKNKYGEDRKSNEIKRFYEPDKNTAAAAAPTWKAGSF